jgi:hypothetical protein
MEPSKQVAADLIGFSYTPTKQSVTRYGTGQSLLSGLNSYGNGHGYCVGYGNEQGDGRGYGNGYGYRNGNGYGYGYGNGAHGQPLSHMVSFGRR